ncbi:hypothetical protein [Microbacterium sp.]|uniref:hypothetical protein n=1 Tax=Microbacterium sp. TaxID=51671 RepID=UPI002811CB58|nr:hypothetical protein [Microbacterium sp.]
MQEQQNGPQEEPQEPLPQGGDEQIASRPDRPQQPTTSELQEPSTEKDPGDEPKAPPRDEPEPDHRAVGIGVVDTPEPTQPEQGTPPDGGQSEADGGAGGT